MPHGPVQVARNVALNEISAEAECGIQYGRLALSYIASHPSWYARYVDTYLLGVSETSASGVEDTQNAIPTSLNAT